MSRSLTFRLESKNAVVPNTLEKKKKAVMFITVTMSTYQDQLNTGVSKVCEKCKVCGIDSLKYVREFYTLVCYVATFPRP